MEAVIGFCLQVLAFLFLISAGGIIISFFLDVVISLFDEHEGVYVNKNKGDTKETRKTSSIVEDKDKIVVYKDLPVPEKEEPKKKQDMVNGEVVSDIDYDKAAEEQRMLMSKNGGAPAPQESFDSRPQFNQPQPEKSAVFMDDEDDEDDEYATILDDVVNETKKQIKDEKNGGKKKKAPVVVEDDEDLNELVEEEKPVAPQKRKVIYKERTQVDDETKAAREKELQELKELKEQQKQELEEFRKLKEEFAKDKEKELLAIKNDDDPTDDKEELDKLRAELEAERAEIERLREELNKEPEVIVPETIVQEKIIKDDEEIKRLKLKNLERMNARLTRILKSVDKVEEDKRKLLAKQEEQKKKQEERQKYEEQLRQQKQMQLELAQKEYEKQKEKKAQEEEKQRQEREALKRKQEEQRSVELAKKEELKKRLLEPLEKRPSKYNLNTGAKKTASTKTSEKSAETSVEHFTEEVVTEEVEEITTSTQATAKSKSVVKPNRASNDEIIVKEVVVENQKPLYGKDYYENRILELQEEMKEAEKELRLNKQEYIPLTRIHRAYARDSEKLRKKELVVAKQKVALYGVNASKIDPVKKEKLNESLKQLAELKDSVEHCQEIIKKNKDRYPILEKNNKLIVKHIAKIQEEIDTCTKAIEYYDKKKK